MSNAKPGDGTQSDNESAAAAPEAEAPTSAANDEQGGDQAQSPDMPQAPDAAETVEVAELEALRAEVSDLKDKLLRAVAETENLRRRTEREKTDLRKFAAAEFARDMLGVADNLQRALAAVPAEAREGNEDLSRLLEGVELTERELLSQFEKHGVKTVEPLGQKLDPNLHQAMVQIEDASVEPGTVVQVMQAGYVIHDRLLRAAMVGVAKGGAKQEPPADTGSTGQSVDTEA